jgi:hypothetical protein
LVKPGPGRGPPTAGDPARDRALRGHVRHGRGPALVRPRLVVTIAGETYLFTYADDPEGVIDRVATRLDAAVGATPALAWLWAFRAKAHARLQPKLHFYEARARVDLGQGHRASAAATRALDLYEPSELNVPLTRFEQASACAVLGDLDEACRIAGEAVGDHRNGRAVAILLRAYEFDSLVGAASNAAAVGEWREVLASVHPLEPAGALAAGPRATIV